MYGNNPYKYSREYDGDYSQPSSHQPVLLLGDSPTSHTTPRTITIYTLMHFLLGSLIGLIIAYVIRSCILGSAPLCIAGERADMIQQHQEPLDIIGGDKNKYPHNSDQNLIFIGVMTAQQYLDTRAVAVYETWAQEIPGKIAFFTSEHSVVKSHIPVIRLPGVDDSYPPQKKSFMMLKYMHDHFLDHFEFFMRADDDVYVRPDKLEMFLRSVNSSQLHFIGQTGKGNTAEFGQLSLLDYENFCMGGPGVILSRYGGFKVMCQ